MRILIVDDDHLVRIPLVDDLSDAGFGVEAVASGEEALNKMSGILFDVVVTDLRMPGMDGIELLHRIKADYPETEVIVMTAYAEIKTAVSAMKLGAYDYIAKPFQNEELILHLYKIGEKKKQREDIRYLTHENIVLKRRLEDRYSFGDLIGKSPAMGEVFRIAQIVAASDSTVLIQGETGTGKEVVARAIHNASPRQNGPFIPVSCASLSKELLESELFGHEKGAFTGAIKEKVGKFQLAHTGTIFLDEVDDIPGDLQVKLLRVLQEHTIERVGGTASIPVDIRVIAATKVDLREKVNGGEYRADLFYRLNVVPILLPPLRERREDIPCLIDRFLHHLSPSRRIAISPQAMRLLIDYPWPGNVRELEHLIERLIVIKEGGTLIEVDDLPAEIRSPSSLTIHGRPALGSAPLPDIIETIERELITEALNKTGGNRTRAANLLGLKPSTFRDKLVRLGIENHEEDS
jgi:DNA-binding NtrC family response regulator